MLLINTTLKAVYQKGIGLFTTEFIPKGKVCWAHDELLDRIITPDVLVFCEPLELEFIEKYGCLLDDGSRHLCLDNARFINHSEEGNVKDGLDEHGKFMFKAMRDIQPGEEITTDYQDICESFKDGVHFDI